MVSAIYVDMERGPYPALLGADACWGVGRDARRFDGAGPVVAHPPCGPWGSMRQFCTRQDRSLAPIAVKQVLEHGGVLEHPAASTLWKHCGLPAPFQWIPLAAPRVWSLMVEQVRWGHPCRKRTKLLIVGASARDVPPFPAPREPTHHIGGDKAWRETVAKPRGMKVLDNKGEGHLTPPAFARWLIQIAQACA